MARRGRTGVTYEVDQALKQIQKFNQPKNGQTGHIHSHKQNKHDYSNAVAYGKWLRSERGKGLYQANKTDYKDYIAYKGKSVSNGHLINIETSLRHLSNGMNKVSKSRGRTPREWVPKERVVASGSREKPSDRSYTPREIERIREHLPSSSKAHHNLTLQNAFGMRLEETSKARYSNFETRGNTTYFVAREGEKITKGGRPRETPCRPEYEKQVRALVGSGRGREQYKFVAAKYNTARSAYSKAADKAGVQGYNGSHGFRHSYARAQLNDRLAQRDLAERGREVIDRMLDNRDNGLRKDTGFKLEEKKLYKEVNAIIDTVHADLGHGKGRLDLVAIYMR